MTAPRVQDSARTALTPGAVSIRDAYPVEDGAAPGLQIRVVDRPSVVRETTGSRLTRLRMMLDWSQEDLAFEAGLTQGTVCLIETDQKTPRADTLDALADALGVSMGYLWKGEGGDILEDDSPHQHCPDVLGCREGRTPEGWVRESEVAS